MGGGRAGRAGRAVGRADDSSVRWRGGSGQGGSGRGNPDGMDVVHVTRRVLPTAEARGEGPQPLTADEARAATAAEGLELVLSSLSSTGFKCVTKHHGKYKAEFRDNCKQRYLGIFATPEEAALSYARHIGAERAAAEAAEARVAVRDDAQEEVVEEAQEQEAVEEEMAAGPQPLTADEAKAAAVAEGLELVLSSLSSTGFKGVSNDHGKYKVEVWEDGKYRRLGTFATPEEAALCYARHVGAERAAAEPVVVGPRVGLAGGLGERDEAAVGGVHGSRGRALG